MNSDNPEEKQLARWVSTQRVYYNKGKLSKDRIDKLNSINFVWDVFDESWIENYNKLTLFLHKNKGSYPRMCSDNPEEKQLAQWVSMQRVYYNKGKLSEKKIDKLNSIGFVWDAREASWIENFNKLTSFLHDNKGRYPSQSSDNPEEKQLARWVSTQRTDYKSGKLKEYPKRIEALESIDFFRRFSDKRWFENFDKLNSFLHKNKGSYPRQRSNNPEEKQLANWVATQRAYYNQGMLSKDKIDKLNSINFVWRTVYNDESWKSWIENFNKLPSFLEQEGRYPSMCSKNPEENQLARWVFAQRMYYTKRKLSEYEINKLNSIGFVWNPWAKKEKSNQNGTDKSQNKPEDAP